MIKSNKNTDRHSSLSEKFWAETDLNILNSTLNAHFIPFKAPCAIIISFGLFFFSLPFFAESILHICVWRKSELLRSITRTKKAPNSRQLSRTDSTTLLRHTVTPCCERKISNVNVSHISILIVIRIWIVLFYKFIKGKGVLCCHGQFNTSSMSAKCTLTYPN